MSLIKQVWDELHPLEQRKYFEYLQSDLNIRIIQANIKQQFDILASMDTNQPLELLGTQYRNVRAQLDVWREMLLFISKLTMKPLDN